VWSEASGPACCVWVVPVLASVRGLGTDVDVGAVAPELSIIVSRLLTHAGVSLARVVRDLDGGGGGGVVGFCT
jgi:hypothetical protein